MTEFNRNVAYRFRQTQDAMTAKFEAEDRARDPLSYFWKIGVMHMRDTFRKTLDFGPKPEDFYKEGQYHDVCECR